MSCSLRFLLLLLASSVLMAPLQAAGKGHSSSHHQAHKPPHHVSHSKVNHHRRPVVKHRSAPGAHARGKRIVRQPVKRIVVRNASRYPTHRVARPFVRRPYYHHHRHHHRRYAYSYYPGRYQWWTNSYLRRLAGRHRHTPRGISGIVESVTGNAANGTVLVKVPRPRLSRFHYAAHRAGSGWGTTSLRRFHLSTGTHYQIMTNPHRGGSFADLHKGERILILTHRKAPNTAEKVEVFGRGKR